MTKKTCTPLEQVRDVTPSATGCEDFVAYVETVREERENVL